MNLKCVLLSGRCQSVKNICCMIAIIWHSGGKKLTVMARDLGGGVI